MYTIYFTLLGTIMFLFYKNNIWQKWQKLNSLVTYRTTNPILIYWYSIQLIFKIKWLSILQYTNTSIRKCGKNKYELSYIINGKIYRIVTKIRNGPCPILQITNEFEDNIMGVILPFLGPNYDCHNSNFTPSDFGYKSITFIMRSGNDYTFTESEKIKLIN